MASNRTPTRFYGPAKPSSGGVTLYTVATGKIAVIRYVTTYPSDTDGVYIGINGSGSANIVFSYDAVDGEGSKGHWLYEVLVAGDTMEGGTGADNVTLTVNGDLYDA